VRAAAHRRTSWRWAKVGAVGAAAERPAEAAGRSAAATGAAMSASAAALQRVNARRWDTARKLPPGR